MSARRSLRRFFVLVREFGGEKKMETRPLTA